MDFAIGQTLLFNKPKGWTSFDVVKKVRATIRVKKVGHAGTLDPLATGLLIICTGKHTKTITLIQEQEKEYEVIFKLGATTPSYDAEFPEENIMDASGVTREDIHREIQNFVGEIEQTPPIFSAVKVNGKRAYKSARAGEKVVIKSRQVNVYEYSLLDEELPPSIFSAKIRCSKGTYIRTLVHDLGQKLGVGAYIQELKRTRIGDYDLSNALEVAEFAEQFAKK